MIDDLAKVLDRVSAPGDLAVVLLVGPVAYALDAGLDVIGFLPAGYVAAAASCLGLGVKKVVDVRWGAKREREAAERRRTELQTRGQDLWKRTVKAGGSRYLAMRLNDEMELHRDGITTDEQLESVLAQCLEEYRAWHRSTLDSGLEESRG
ncbi:hypothetical protein HPO96_04250 [Kribbella sandramycini]|uniref:Uncharacterized protein n=1 Tax=Kribbella sandramycini TaxID=60450 RepID=A0A7Y4NX31_9ACTN|nr:hypothetical protein [Kribbella sandramycini]MBB6567953.1 hypothetical protein [Kribbella sandramycini]NOL39452.1 hypothetical protein [Kribbella sandramycini]